MDRELIAYLDGRFASLVKLVDDHSQSLQAEMQALRVDMNRGFERVEAATRRNTQPMRH
ncbi:MAG: hypothetical protein LAP87_18815 [Acidobacteriia bacterium]|nr:hypothetical protein [Terriglobia bacterium]